MTPLLRVEYNLVMIRSAFKPALSARILGKISKALAYCLKAYWSREVIVLAWFSSSLANC